MLELKDIHVKYSYKTVLRGINLTFEKGKIYSLLGENGAGKLTLAHVLCGDILPTSGELLLDEKKLKIKNPKDAIKSGIVCVHQRPLLAPSVSIRENLFIGIDKKEEVRIPQLMNLWLPERKPSVLVKNLFPAETFTVSLMGALLKNPSVLILDEPPELENKTLRKLSDSGLTVIIITHSFKEAVEKSDEVVLLKEGIVLEKTPASKITEADIKQKLFGLTKTVAQPDFIEEKDITEEDVLNLRKEIVGSSPTMTHSRKIGYIPSDRTFRASNPNLTIFQLCSAYHTSFKQNILEKYSKELLRKAEVNIKLYEKASCLSGGMLQRIILEREIAENPDELYLFDPTHGLDVEATERLYSRLEALAKNGTKVIIGKAE
jgi:ABC-type uncharacterized transport system ATPase subunit